MGIPVVCRVDLAFHVLALTLVDEDFGKGQLDLMLHGTYIHPSGQLPAYEWNSATSIRRPRVVDDLHLPPAKDAARRR